MADVICEWSLRQFVEPVHERVDVLTFSVASKVIMEGARAKGVEVRRFGKTLEYFACKEVIISAGAIGSPQVLNSHLCCEINLVGFTP